MFFTSQSLDPLPERQLTKKETYIGKILRGQRNVKSVVNESKVLMLVLALKGKGCKCTYNKLAL